MTLKHCSPRSSDECRIAQGFTSDGIKGSHIKTQRVRRLRGIRAPDRAQRAVLRELARFGYDRALCLADCPEFFRLHFCMVFAIDIKQDIDRGSSAGPRRIGRMRVNIWLSAARNIASRRGPIPAADLRSFSCNAASSCSSVSTWGVSCRRLASDLPHSWDAIARTAQPHQICPAPVRTSSTRPPAILGPTPGIACNDRPSSSVRQCSPRGSWRLAPVSR